MLKDMNKATPDDETTEQDTSYTFEPYDPREALVRLGNVVINPGAVIWADFRNRFSPPGASVAIIQFTDIDLVLEDDDAEAARRYFTDATIVAP